MSATHNRSRPFLSSVILYFAAAAFAWPPTGVWAVVTADPDRWRYGAVWSVTLAVPFVALGVVRWYARKRTPLSWTQSWTRAALLVAVTLATGLAALRAGWPNVLTVPFAPFGVALATLVVWIVAWKIADSRRPFRAPPVAHRPVPVTTGGGTTARAAGKKPKRKGPKEGAIWWAYVPSEVRKVEQHRPCIVVRAHAKHAYVLPVSQHQGRGELRLPPEGWSGESDRPSYVRLEPLSKVSYHRFDQRMGQCPPDVWRRILAHHPPDQPPTTQRRTPPTPPPAAPPPSAPPPPQRPRDSDGVARPRTDAPRHRQPPRDADGVPQRR